MAPAARWDDREYGLPGDLVDDWLSQDWLDGREARRRRLAMTNETMPAASPDGACLLGLSV